MAGVPVVAKLFLLSLATLTAGELLQNGGFESLQHWDCPGCTCTLTTTHHNGAHAVKVTDRKSNSVGPSQDVTLTPGTRYKVDIWVRLLNDKAGKLFQNIEVVASMQTSDGHWVPEHTASKHTARASDGWIHLTGSFQAPPQTLQVSKIKIDGPDPEVDFVVDTASVTVIPENVHWKANTDHVIDRIRKSNINFHVTTAANIDKADVQIHVLQTKKSFPFGTAVHAKIYNGGLYPTFTQRYRDFVHTHFNWATIANSLKWDHTEPTQGHTDYTDALATLDGLNQHGVKVRGHCLVWSVEKWVHNWVKALSGNALRHAVTHHIQDITHLTNGKLEHWDVNNENLHGQWFQETLHDANYDIELFREAHRLAPHAKLFLNDFNVIAFGGATDEYRQLAMKLKTANAGIYGIGVQSHFHDEQEPDPTLIKYRLDQLAEAGLSIWVTELDVTTADEHKKADFYEKALRAFYGHPAVDGIIFWGFWEHAMSHHRKSALVDTNWHLTEAGRRVLDLLENQWMTDETHRLSQTGNQFTVRGFHGDYEVHVIYQGRELANLKQIFSVGKDDKTVNINVHT